MSHLQNPQCCFKFCFPIEIFSPLDSPDHCGETVQHNTDCDKPVKVVTKLMIIRVQLNGFLNSCYQTPIKITKSKSNTTTFYGGLFKSL